MATKKEKKTTKKKKATLKTIPEVPTESIGAVKIKTEIEPALDLSDETVKSEKKASRNNTVKIKYMNVGRGTHYLPDGTKIKPKEQFMAFPSQIPVNFRDIIKPVDPEQNQAELAEALFSATSFSIAEDRDNPGLFNVVTLNGKAMNSVPMTREKAEATLEALQNG